MRTIIIIICMSGIFSHSFGQYDNKVSTCQSELSALQSKRAAIDAEYDLIVDELRSGLFCSQCNRSKSEIEKGGQSFSQHLKDVKGNVVQAPQKAYDQAHKNYLQKFNQWQESVKSKQKSCEGMQQDAVNDYNRKQQQAAQENKNKQQLAQQQYNQAQEQNRLVQQQAQEKVQQQLQQQIQQQQAAADAALLQQQQNFSQMVNNYAATQNQENQQRQQDLDKIAKHGADLGNSIQGNTPDITKIAGQNWNDKPVFGDVPSYEDIMKANAVVNQVNGNNYFDQYSSLVQEVGINTIITESNLPETFQNGYEQVTKYMGYGNAARDIMDGKITEDVVSTYFSQTQNSVIQTIQNHTGSIAVKNANTVTELVDRMGQDDYSEQDVNNAINAMNPLHFSPTFVKSEKPWSVRDTLVVVGGGILLSAVAAPIWIGIGAAAWYGFNR